MWRVKKRWHKSLPEVLFALSEIAHGADQAKADIAAARAEQKRQADEAGRAAFDAMPAFENGISSQVLGDKILIGTAYHDRIVTLFRSLDGKYQGDKRWALPISCADEIIAERQNIIDWHNESVENAREKEERRIQRRANRKMYLLEDCPAIGNTIQIGENWMTVDGHGKSFRADENTSSMGGPIGAEGREIRYVYFRPASDDETSAAIEAERQHKEQAQKIAAQNAAIMQVAQGETAPTTGSEPAGQIIWSQKKHSLVGYRTWIVLGEDGWLYHLTYDGSDGAAWGDYNAGHNTRATRIKADENLVADILGGKEHDL